MNEIKVSVSFKNGECRVYDYEPINNDYNVSKLVFSFDEEYTGRKVVEIRPVGDSKNATFSSEIINNEVILVKEENGQNKSIFTKSGKHVIEVHLYNDGRKITALGIRPFNVKEEQINIGDSQATVYLPVFDQMIQELDNGLDDLSSGLTSLNEAITETNNLNLDVSKSGKLASVIVTKKDGTVQTVTLSDGTNLMFHWNGTRLGIKTDSDADYTYVDLQGIQGEKGDTGAPFTVKKTYVTIQAMIDDYDNMQINDYVMISGNVEQEDNAKLFTKTETEDPTYRWQYLADFSGATGIQGETGLTPNIQIGQVVNGNSPSVTRSGTNENPILNFTLVKGDKGDTGATGAIGATGNGISSITKTGTSDNVDTYTITYTNGQTSTFTVTNGEVSEAELEVVRDDVYDVKRNQLLDTQTGTSISTTEAFDTKVLSFKLSKESTQSGTPTPDNPIEINTIKGYRNLFNKSTAIDGKEIRNAGTGTFGDNNDWFITDYIPIKASTTYTVSGKLNGAAILYYDESKNFVSGASIGGNTQFTTSTGVYYAILNGKITQKNTFMLVEGSTTLPYVPYGTNWIYTSISDGTNTNNVPIPLNDNEMFGLTFLDVFYGDEVIVDNNGRCYLRKRFGKRVFDGTQTGYSKFKTKTSTIYWECDQVIFQQALTSDYRPIALCDKLQRKAGATLFVDDIEGFTITTNKFRFSLNSTIATEVADVKTWLGTHNLVVYGLLKTEQLIDLNYTVDLKLFSGANTITNSETANMTITYVLDIQDEYDKKQDTLVSGTNIKTINNQSLLGSGNISISGGGGSATDIQINGTSIVSNDVANIITKGTYNASSNKIATESDLPTNSDFTLNGLSEKSYNNLTDKPTIPTVPTNVSAFTNDAGYLIQHQDISGKLDTSKVKSTMSTTSGDVYNVTYINGLIGDINTILATLTTPSNGGGE